MTDSQLAARLGQHLRSSDALIQRVLVIGHSIAITYYATAITAIIEVTDGAAIVQRGSRVSDATFNLVSEFNSF